MAAPSRARVIAAFLALYVIWGSTYLFIKWTVAGIPPFLAAAFRHGTAGILLYAWARLRGASRPTAKQWGVAALVGTLFLVTGNGTVNWASQRIPSGLSALIVACVPIWIIVIDWIRPKGVRPGRRTIVGVALGSIGVAGLVISAGGIRAGTAGSASSVVLACIALVLGSLSWASGTILTRQLPRHTNGALATAMEMAAGGVLLLPISWLLGDMGRFDFASVPASSWLSLAYLVTAGSLIGFSAYTWLLRVSTPAKVATYAYVNPVVAVALGWAFAGERLTRGTFVAAAVILFAVVVVTIPSRAALRQVFGAR